MKIPLLVLVGVLLATVAHAQAFAPSTLIDPRPLLQTDRHYTMEVVNIDGRPGDELLIWVYGVAGYFQVLYPHHPQGPCLSEPFIPTTPFAICDPSGCHGYSKPILADVLPVGAPDGIKDLILFNTVNRDQPWEIAQGTGRSCVSNR